MSPVRWVYKMARLCPAPSTLVIYQGARHALTESLAPVLGPPWRATIADWLLDRVNGIPAQDEFRYVTVTGAWSSARMRASPGLDPLPRIISISSLTQEEQHHLRALLEKMERNLPALSAS